MENFDQKLFGSGIVPVVVIDDEKDSTQLAETLYNSGIETMEITMRTDAAIEAIRNVAKNVPDMLVGAGTVTNITMAIDAVNAGAKYIVMPGLNVNVVRWCLDRKIPVFPGVTTPTEIMSAMELGLDRLKFFPAEQSGGAKKIKSFASPFSNITFMPTGGVSKDNINEYLNLPNVKACGGSWICPKDLVKNGDFETIQTLCEEALKEIQKNA